MKIDSKGFGVWGNGIGYLVQGVFMLQMRMSILFGSGNERMNLGNV